MPDIVNAQFMQSNTYLTQLREQFTRIAQQIEGGETVMLHLTEGDRAMSLVVSREHVVDRATPIEPSTTRKPRALADNDSLIAGLTKTFSFDIAEANRNIPSAEIHAHITRAAVRKTVAGSERDMRSASELPNPTVSFNGSEWILADDCVYAALDGCTVTVKNGFKTDLASIPRLLWAFIASFELSLVAPIVHDLIYSSTGKVVLPDGEVSAADKIFAREEADDLFLELMARAKVAYWKRNIAYLAVRGFGGSSWRQR